MPAATGYFPKPEEREGPKMVNALFHLNNEGDVSRFSFNITGLTRG